MALPPHLELLKRMEEISEAGYAGGWIGNLEYGLWNLVEAGTPATCGLAEIDRATVERLRALRTTGSHEQLSPSGERQFGCDVRRFPRTVTGAGASGARASRSQLPSATSLALTGQQIQVSPD